MPPAACAQCCKTLADARAHAAALLPPPLSVPPPTAATLPSHPPQPCAPLPPPAQPRPPGPAQRVQLPAAGRDTQPCPAGRWHAVRWRHPALRCRRSATRWPQSWRSWASTSSAPASSTCPTTHGWVGGAAWQVLPARLRRCGMPLPAARKACPSPACRPLHLAPSAAHSLGATLPLQLRALDRKSTKFEKTKNEKCGSHMWSDVTELAALIRWVGR